ncbi:MAG: DUF1848 domain-containing protein [Spirochaetaceae bacterium]|nr:DUF1848 domain-containing protein [Spirochaetaceae bacterium]
MGEKPEADRRPQIISASRRTDLPSFQADWFFGQLAQGWVEVRNPWNARQRRTISLAPENVICFVFWTRDPRPMMDRLERLRTYKYLFHYTINAYGPPLEPDAPSLEYSLRTIRDLADRIGRERIIWRYDPLILTESHDEAWHGAAFAELAEKLRGWVRHCVISVYDSYRGAQARLRAAGLAVPALSELRENYVHLLAMLVKIAHDSDIAVALCAEPSLQDVPGISRIACIDEAVIREVAGPVPVPGRDRCQREGCTCLESVDIGAYGTCQRHCLYCYARRGRD